jgi:hypothetical protein
MSKSKAGRLVLAIEKASHVAEAERDMAHIATDLFGATQESYQEALKEVSEMSDAHLITLMGMSGDFVPMGRA